VRCVEEHNGTLCRNFFLSLQKSLQRLKWMDIIIN